MCSGSEKPANIRQNEGRCLPRRLGATMCPGPLAKALRLQIGIGLTTMAPPVGRCSSNRAPRCRYLRRTFSLKSNCHHYVAMYVSPIWDHIANIDADAEAHGTVGGLIAI